VLSVICVEYSADIRCVLATASAVHHLRTGYTDFQILYFNEPAYLQHLLEIYKPSCNLWPTNHRLLTASHRRTVFKHATVYQQKFVVLINSRNSIVLNVVLRFIFLLQLLTPLTPAYNWSPVLHMAL